MIKETRINNSKFFLVWLINPFLSAVYLIKNLSNQSAILPFLLISFYFGFSFVVDPSSNADSNRYAQDLVLVFENQPTFYNYIFANYLSEEGGELDLYQPLLTWFVGQITPDYRWLFSIYSMVFGFFWFKSILLIREKLTDKLNLLPILVLLTIAVINPIWSINGVRMWTAIQIFFYGYLVYSLNKKRKMGWGYMILAMFVHFSLVFPLLLFFGFNLLPFKWLPALFVFYIGTYFIGELDLDFIRVQFEKLPSFMQSRQSYLSEAYIEGLQYRANQSSWHVIWAKSFEQYAFMGMAIWIYIMARKRNFKNRESVHNILSFTLFFGGIANLLTNVPSGGRFLVLSHMIIGMVFLFSYIQEVSLGSWRVFKLPFQFMLLFVIVFQIRMGLDYVGVSFFLGNPVLSVFSENNVPLIKLIKDIL